MHHHASLDHDAHILQLFQFCHQIICHPDDEISSPHQQKKKKSDLLTVIRELKSSSSSSLGEDEIRFIVCQILLALRALHLYGVIHRDLSCGNILIDETAQITVCNFGSACYVGMGNEKGDGIEKGCTLLSRYSAPEVLAEASYGTKSDLFSVGVIMAELLGKELFSGTKEEPVDALEQLHRLLSVLGAPDCYALFEDADGSFFSASNAAKAFMARWAPSPHFGMPHRSTLAGDEDEDSAAMMCVLESLLALDPRDRPTAEEALEMEWFDSLRDYIDQECDEQNWHFSKTRLDSNRN